VSHREGRERHTPVFLQQSNGPLIDIVLKKNAGTGKHRDGGEEGWNQMPLTNNKKSSRAQGLFLSKLQRGACEMKKSPPRDRMEMSECLACREKMLPLAYSHCGVSFASGGGEKTSVGNFRDPMSREAAIQHSRLSGGAPKRRDRRPL